MAKPAIKITKQRGRWAGLTRKASLRLRRLFREVRKMRAENSLNRRAISATRKTTKTS